ncbi:MAG: DUF1906 domain-containing protein, partial [Deferribacterales bacterium]
MRIYKKFKKVKMDTNLKKGKEFGNEKNGNAIFALIFTTLILLMLTIPPITSEGVSVSQITTDKQNYNPGEVVEIKFSITVVDQYGYCTLDGVDFSITDGNSLSCSLPVYIGSYTDYNCNEHYINLKVTQGYDNCNQYGGSNTYNYVIYWQIPNDWNSGTYIIRVEASSGGQTSTPVTKSFTVTLPDLIITNIWESGNRIYYTIKNQGSGTAGSSYSALYIDGSYKCYDDVASLAPGESRTESFSCTYTCSGTSDTIKVKADAWNYVSESNEGNNERTETWKCQPDLKGIDTSVKVSKALDCLKREKISFIGRYYAGKNSWKAITKEEAQRISNAGIYIVSIWQESANYARYFSYNRGKEDGYNAFKYAKKIGQPSNTPIYFAVDFDVIPEDKEKILDYFEGVKEGYNQY